MKLKVFSVIALAACLLTGFTSCSDKEATTQDNPQSEIADYTVIYWGSAGNNESSTLSDMADLLLKREEGKINNKVNVVGCFDPTMKYSNALAAKKLGGTIEFELGTKRNIGDDVISTFKKFAGFENALKMDEVEEPHQGDEDYLNADFVDLYAKVFASMKSCKANSEYCIYSSESLSQFIAKAAKEHPAKNYILVLYGHGTGFDPSIEGNAGNATRMCLPSTDGEERSLALDDVANGITNSKVEVKTVLYQCCQMATLEIFATMKNCTDYLIASAEPTFGGYFPQFIVNLSEAGATEEGMKTACKKAVDFYVDDCLSSSKNKHLSSHGFYELSKTDELLKPISEASTWFASAAKTNPTFMNDVVMGSVQVYSVQLTGLDPDLTYKLCHRFQTNISENLKGGKLKASEPEEVMNLVGYVETANHKYVFATCFANMMERALSDDLKAEAEGLDREALKKIYTNYMSALKQMAYIRCNGTEANDAAYRYASPSINVFSMNEQGYHCNWREFEGENPEAMMAQAIWEPLSQGDEEGAFKMFVNTIGGTIFALTTPSVSEVKARYQSTDFDKATGWSKVLENVNVNPLLLVNPTRYDIISK